MPGSLTNNVALSGDGKYLIGSYLNLDGSGNAYAYNCLLYTSDAADE